MESMATAKEDDTPKPRVDVDRAILVLRALSNPHRLKILMLLRQEELSVGALEQAVGIRQPSMSQQLARLREDKLVTARRDGKLIYYSLVDSRVERLLVVIGKMFEPRAA